MIGQKTDAQLLRDLAAREEIKELRARYGWHVARGDYDRIAELFTPAGVFEVLNDGRRTAYRGREAIRALLASRAAPGQLFPMIHNEIITVDGDHAFGSCAMQSLSPLPGQPGFSGYYHDRFEVREGRWLFTERRFFFYIPVFERSGLDLDGQPETGLAAQHERRPDAGPG
jgi:hypothetical protein